MNKEIEEKPTRAQVLLRYLNIATKEYLEALEILERTATVTKVNKFFVKKRLIQVVTSKREYTCCHMSRKSRIYYI